MQAVVRCALVRKISHLVAAATKRGCYDTEHRARGNRIDRVSGRYALGRGEEGRRRQLEGTAAAWKRLGLLQEIRLAWLRLRRLSVWLRGAWLRIAAGVLRAGAYVRQPVLQCAGSAACGRTVAATTARIVLSRFWQVPPVGPACRAGPLA